MNIRIELRIMQGEHDRPGAISAKDVEREVTWLREAGHTYVAAMLERLWAALHPALDPDAAADAFLFASRAQYGSSTYAADIQRVLNAMGSVTEQREALTEAAHKQIVQSQTDQLVATVADLRVTLKEEVGKLRREINQQTRTSA